MYPNYNTPYYMQDLQSMRDRIDKQLQQMQQINQPQQTPITQNFQLAPSQNSSIKYAETIEDVKKDLVFGDTLFVNKDYTYMWLKNARGDIKTYEVKEIVILDEKDTQIKNLTAQIEELKKELNNYATNVNEYANVKTSSTKSTTSKSTKANDV